MSESDEDIPQLSRDTLMALQEFCREQAEKEIQFLNCNSKPDSLIFDENWQLSQFWYDNSTINTLTDVATKLLKPIDKIALISCPTLYKSMSQKHEGEVMLFEYDKRFAIYGPHFVFYDYKKPLDIDRSLGQQFDLVIADPPFLSEECLTKSAVTIKFLARSNIILCTGAIMAQLAEKLLNVKENSFKPKHKNNLANEFLCYSNFDLDKYM